MILFHLLLNTIDFDIYFFEYYAIKNLYAGIKKLQLKFC
jgi:hypothetical protein